MTKTTAKIKAVTQQTRTGVAYAVESNGAQVWACFVPFGKAKRYRAGGSAFVEAAHEQERQAQRAGDPDQ